MGMHEAIQAFQLAEQSFDERVKARGILFDPALGVEAGLLAALPHLERIEADESAVPVAYQSKRRPEDYPDKWRECSKETFDTINRTKGSPWITRELFDRPPKQAAQVDYLRNAYRRTPMTTPSLLDDLEGVMAARAEWIESHSDIAWNELALLSVNFVSAHHAEIADMAKRLEAAERDSKRLDWLERNAINITLDGRLHRVLQIGAARAAIDAATQEGEG